MKSVRSCSFFACAVYVIFLSFPCYGTSDYVSYFGVNILANSDIIARGVLVDTTYLHGGGRIVHFEVREIYHGYLEVGKTISLCYLQEKSTGDSLFREDRVVFLKSLSSPVTFRVIGEFSLHEKEGEQKLKALLCLIDLEKIPDIEDKNKSYIQYCLQGLTGSEVWPRAHALREWQYLVTTHSRLYSRTLLLQLRQLYPKLSEESVREQIKKDIFLLEQRLQAQISESPQTDKSHKWTESLQSARDKLQKSSSHDEKIQALALLGLFPGRESQEAFIVAMKDHSHHIRAQAVFYAGFHKYRGAIPDILAILQHDPSLRVRKNAIAALGNLHAVEATAEIRRYLKLPYTRNTARLALQKLTGNIHGTSR